MTVNETIDGRWPSRAAADHAAESITERRTRADDPDLAQLRDSLLDVADYVATRHNVSRENIRADVRDAWMITDYIRRQTDLIRGKLLAAAVDAGDTYASLADMCGVTTRQGVEALVRRLEAAAAGHSKDATHARAAHASARAVDDEAARLAGTAMQLTRFLSTVGLPDDLQTDFDDLRADMLRGAHRVFVARARLLVADLLTEHPDWVVGHAVGQDLTDYQQQLRSRAVGEG
jgi:hypothetical protein